MRTDLKNVSQSRSERKWRLTWWRGIEQEKYLISDHDDGTEQADPSHDVGPNIIVLRMDGVDGDVRDTERRRHETRQRHEYDRRKPEWSGEAEAASTRDVGSVIFDVVVVVVVGVIVVASAVVAEVESHARVGASCMGTARRLGIVVVVPIAQQRRRKVIVRGRRTDVQARQLLRLLSPLSYGTSQKLHCQYY